MSLDSLTDVIPLLALLKPPLTIVAISAYSRETLRDLKSVPSFTLEVNSIYDLGLVKVNAAPLFGELSSPFTVSNYSNLSLSWIMISKLVKSFALQ